MATLVFSGQRLRDACAAQGLSAEALARRARRSTAAIYKYRTDKARPGAEALAAIAQALGLPLESLYVRVPDDTEQAPAQGRVA